MEDKIFEAPQQDRQPSNSFVKVVLIVIIGIFTFGAGIFSGVMISNQTKMPSIPGNPGSTNLPPQTTHALLDEVIDIAKTSYVRPLSEEDLARSVLLGLDPYSVYLNPDDYRKFTEQTTGEYSGIGVMIQLDDNKRSVLVYQVFRPSPADSVGVEEGWTIHSINGEVITVPDLDVVAGKIKGDSGTNVTIEFLANGRSIIKTITRAKVEVDTVAYNVIEGDVGYIRFSGFMANSAQEMRDAINNLKLKGAKRFILDIRRNGGGLLKTCQDIGSLFIKSGVLVTVKDRNKQKRDLECRGPGFEFPLVLLVDKYSASASEILAGALQDHKIATLVGQRTYGKGLVQNIIPMRNGGAVKITIQQYMRPSGKPVDFIGISPDITVDMNENKPIPKDYKKDPAMVEALKVLGGK